MAALGYMLGNAPERDSAEANGRLERVRRTLAELPEGSLHALRAMALEPTEIAPELMLWVEHAIGWEIDRRVQLDYRLHAPLDAIDSDHVTSSILMLAALPSRFVGA